MARGSRWLSIIPAAAGLSGGALGLAQFTFRRLNTGGSDRFEGGWGVFLVAPPDPVVLGWEKKEKKGCLVCSDLDGKRFDKLQGNCHYHYDFEAL